MLPKITLRAALPLTAALLFSAGCKSAGPDDAALTQSVQAQLSSDRAITGQPIQTAVSAGVVTLSGSVANDAQRTIAARDAAGIQGVKEVVNNISIASAQATIAPPAPLPVPTRHSDATLKPSPAQRVQSSRQAAPVERPQQQSYTPPQQAYQPPVQQAAPPPPPPPQPTFRTVTVSSGDTLPVRVTQTLDSATTQPDSSFSGVVASDIVVDGIVAIPAGTPVTGHVDAVQEAAHFKGNSLLTVSLTSLTRRGDRNVSLSTEPYTVEGKGRGKNTAEKTGGGAAVGAILGGIFGGGKGAAIGAATGGGLGAGSNAITRGQQVQIPSESVVRFRLSNPITVRVRTDNSTAPQRDSTLSRRPDPS